MEIKLTDTRLDITKDGNSLSFISPIDKDKIVLHLSSNKQTLTYSLEELELRAVYEMLRRRYG